MDRQKNPRHGSIEDCRWTTAISAAGIGTLVTLAIAGFVWLIA